MIAVRTKLLRQPLFHFFFSFFLSVLMDWIHLSYFFTSKSKVKSPRILVAILWYTIMVRYKIMILDFGGVAWTKCLVIWWLASTFTSRGFSLERSIPLHRQEWCILLWNTSKTTLLGGKGKERKWKDLVIFLVWINF